MPLYKYVGNRILTTVENAVAGADLTEWHSGYRAYSRRRAAGHPVRAQRRRLRLRHADHRAAASRPGSASSRSRSPPTTATRSATSTGMAYAGDVVDDVVRYRAHKMGFGSGELAFASSAYEAKDGRRRPRTCSSSGSPRARQPGRVLDLGCCDGAPGRRARDSRGHHVTGVDLDRARRREGAGRPLRPGRPRRRAPRRGPGHRSTSSLAADVLEHVRQPDALLAQLRPCSPRRAGARQRAELRALVPAHAGRPRPLRLRPARHPRPRPRAVLHPAQLRAPGRTAPATRRRAARPPACPSRSSTGVASTAPAAPAHAGAVARLDRAAVRRAPAAVRVPVPLRAPTGSAVAVAGAGTSPVPPPPSAASSGSGRACTGPSTGTPR